MDLTRHPKPLRVLPNALGALAAVIVVTAVVLCVQAGWSWRTRWTRSWSAMP